MKIATRGRANFLGAQASLPALPGSLPGFPERSHRRSQGKLPVCPSLSEEKNMRPKNIFTLLLLSLVCFGITAMAQENPFLGKWDITGVGQHSNYVYWLEVKEEDGKLTGSFLNRSGSVLPLEEIKIEGGDLIFSPKATHRAKVEDGRLLGMMTAGDQEVAWIGVRPPKWGGDFNANKRYRMGSPVVLFDGKTIENMWELRRKDQPSGWTVIDGVMTNEPKANDLVTRHRFDDFKIQCEYKIEEKSNSGIYLRGRYELQVLDDAGKPPDIHGHMALYSRVKPAVNAGGALDSDEGAPGPIMLQGDHGKVSFRKVVVTPILNSR